jgi:GT2 family glycosyltransferase
MTTISFITVNYRCRDLLQRLLDSVSTLDSLPALEWIIVDNSPEPERLSETLRWPSQIERTVVIDNPRNTGFGAGCNLGAACAVGEILLFINPDCRFAGGTMMVIMEKLIADDKVAAVGPRLVNSAGAVEFSGLPFFGILSDAWVMAQKRLARISLLKSALTARFYHPRHVDWVTGGAMFVRRDAFTQVGGFDEDYFLYYEDADLCLRLHNIGRDILYEPAFSLIHNHGGSVAVSGDLVSRHYRQSQLLYYKKHKKLLSNMSLELYLRLTGRYPASISD